MDHRSCCNGPQETDWGRGHIGDTHLPVLRSTVQEFAQDEQNLPACKLPTQAIAAFDVCGSREPCQQTGSKRADSFPVGLCLTRGVDEQVILNTSDGDIVVGVMELRSNHVKLVFQAPKSVRILRSELLKRGAVS